MKQLIVIAILFIIGVALYRQYGGDGTIPSWISFRRLFTNEDEKTATSSQRVTMQKKEIAEILKQNLRELETRSKNIPLKEKTGTSTTELVQSSEQLIDVLVGLTDAKETPGVTSRVVDLLLPKKSGSLMECATSM